MKRYVEWYVEKCPLNNASFCGDAGFLKEYDNKLFTAVIDVLGHGKEADPVAGMCLDFLECHYREDLTAVVSALHEHIRGTRGAVVSLCRLDLQSGELAFVGVGDTTVRICNASDRRLVSRSGVIGYALPTLKQETTTLTPGDVMLLHTDGVSGRYYLEDYPELLKEDAQTIVRHIMSQFGKVTDDALFIAVKYMEQTVIGKQ